jgi:NAD(P)-dependent dehydrogenase (short-subunit alcohol dehydrogenase family)
LNCVILGASSDIAKELAARLQADGWTIYPVPRNGVIPNVRWDLVIVAIGTLAPVKKFFECDLEKWREGFEVNAILPLAAVHMLYKTRAENAAICFFGGTNPYKASPYYSAYASAKAALRMAVRDLAAEEKELRIFMLDTGFVQTKIHKPTIESGIYNERLAQGGGTPHEQIYAALQKCLRSPIANISGHYFYVPHIA